MFIELYFHYIRIIMLPVFAVEGWRHIESMGGAAGAW